jgi:hypothetical protein
MTDKNTEIDQNIELYFFDPNQEKDNYIDFYKEIKTDRCNKEKGYRYSPLFLLMKDIRYCFGARKQFNPIRKNGLDPANFAGVILTHLAFNNLVKKFYSGNYVQFAKRYMGIANSEDLDALNDLRNALVHNNYSLSVYNKKKEEKIYFSLGLGDGFREVIKKDDNWKTDYKSSRYRVNPRKLMSAFEHGCREYKNYLLDHNNSKARQRFSEAFDTDQWTFIHDLSVVNANNETNSK